MGSKKCTRCKQVKSQMEFHKNRTSKDGLQNVCKDCSVGRGIFIQPDGPPRKRWGWEY